MKVEFKNGIKVEELIGPEDIEFMKLRDNREKFYGSKFIEDFENLDNCVYGKIYAITNEVYPYQIITSDKFIRLCRYIISEDKDLK